MAIRRSGIGFTIAVLAALALSASAFAQADAPELFGVPDSNTTITIPMEREEDLWASRRVIQMNQSVLAFGRAAVSLGGVSHVATRTSYEEWRDEESAGSVSRWKIEGVDGLSTVTVRNGWITGRFFDRSGREFYLMPARLGQPQELLEVDPVAAARMWAEATGGNDVVIPPAELAGSVRPAATTVSMLGANTVAGDVVIHKVTVDMFYTAEVSAYFGGDAAAEVAMQNAEEEINTCFINGGYAEGRVWVRRILRWGQETGNMQTDLYALSADPIIAAQRDLDRADMVSWWVAGGGGIGYLGSIKSSGFHVVGVLSGITNHTEAHEAGHNFGAQHDWENANSFPPAWIYPYGYGYWNDVHADVMSYVGTRRQFYSNPGIYQGSEMGNENRDNLRVIRERLPLVAAFYEESLGGGECVSSNTTLCLLQMDGVAPGSSRFQVEVIWTDFEGNSGLGQAMSLTSDSGWFWFFGPSNAEVFVKILDGRSLGGHFWVFGAGMTTVEVTMTVTDTVTGAVKEYYNPMGSKFQPIEDTSAFTP